MKLNLKLELESILLGCDIIPGREAFNFFKILTLKSFSDIRLNTEKHNLPLEYTHKLLSYYIKPKNKFSLNYLSDIIFNRLITDIGRKEFADNVYFITGLFPKFLEKNKVNKDFYIDSSKSIYYSLSNKRDDVFYQLSKNLSAYIKALNIMREKYFDGRYAKSLIKSSRVLH